MESKLENIKEKSGVFSYNPAQAMTWLVQNPICFSLLSYIILKKDRPYYHFPNLILNEDETIICLNNIKFNLTYAQMNRALNNLENWGFIENLKYKPVFRIKGIKKIKLLVNIFDSEVIKYAEECKKIGGMFYEF